MTRDEMRMHFLRNGSISVRTLIGALWPGFASTKNDIMESHVKVKATSTSILRDLGIFGAKLLMCYAFLVVLLLPLASSVIPKAKTESVAWIITSLESRGAVYVLLREQNDPKIVARTANYLERRGNINAALVAWEATSEILKEHEKPLNPSEIQRHIERLKIHSKPAL